MKNIGLDQSRCLCEKIYSIFIHFKYIPLSVYTVKLVVGQHNCQLLWIVWIISFMWFGLPDSSSHINAAEAIRPFAKCWWFGCNVGLLKRKLRDRWCCRCWKGLYTTVSQSSKLVAVVIVLAVRSILVPYIRIIHIFFWFGKSFPGS